MAQEPSDHGAEVTQFRDATKATNDKDPQAGGPTGFGSLSNESAEAIPRLSELEARVDQLSKVLNRADPQARSDAASVVDDSQLLRELADWLGEVNDSLANAPWRSRFKAVEGAVGGGESTAAQDPSPDQRRDEDELRHLRLLYANVAHRLAQAERGLRQVQGQRMPRRSRARRPLWKRVARRLGVGRIFPSSNTHH